MFTPQALREQMAVAGVDGVVSVQARQSKSETEWLLELAFQNDFIKAVVGWVDLTSPRVHDDLERFARSPKLKAVRHVVQAEPDEGFVLRGDFNRGIGELRKFSLAYDILIVERQLLEIIQLVDAHSDQVFVLDHLGKPQIKEGRFEPWSRRLSELAKRPNVYCKVSGLVTEANWVTWTEAELRPYTTVLGPPEFAATRINLAQSCNGIGWIFGPIAGGMFFYGKDAAGVSTGSLTLWIPYVSVAVAVIVLAAIFHFAHVPDVKTEDVYHLDDSRPNASRSIWAHPHFVLAVAAQFLYVAAQSGIFSFFINYMTTEVPSIPASWRTGMMASWFENGKQGGMALSDKGAAYLASLGFACFLAGRFSGAAILKKYSPHKVLGLYGLLNVVTCLLVVLKLGWPSVVCVFLSYFFMSIMFPAIFALGIHGLGSRAKKASAFIVMAIMGGAIVPKLMGAVGDHYGRSLRIAPISRTGLPAGIGCFYYDYPIAADGAWRNRNYT